MKSKIILGDLHFGIKRFSESFYKNQLSFFEKQLFPYMEKNKITEIIQLGDIFDNRVTIDIKFLNLIDNFFNKLKEKNITFYTLLGNHDIYYRNSREVSLIDFFAKKYDNIILFKEKTLIDFERERCLFVPWLTKGENLTEDEIKNVDFIFGHFEIRNFQIMPGIVDKDSELTEDFFENGKAVKNVFSGHYHIKSMSKIVEYVGTPYQLNWGDFKDFKGFYVWDGIDTDFIENKISKKFVKIEIFKDKFVIKGLQKEDEYFNIKDFKTIIKEIEQNNFIKIIEKENNPDVKVVLSEEKIDVPILKEVSFKDIENAKHLDDIANSGNTEKIILNIIKNYDENLVKYYNNLLQKVKKEFE